MVTGKRMIVTIHQSLFTRAVVKKYSIFITMLSAWLICTGVPAYDNGREQLIAERLQDRLKVGEAVRIQTDKSDFFSIYTEQISNETQGAIILLHNLGGHPDWPVVTSPLRKSMPQRGWTTLSIQLPVLPPEESIAAYGKTLADACQRLDKALTFLSEKEIETVVLLGYGFGAATAMHCSTQMNSNDSLLLGIAAVSPLAQPFLRPPLKLLEVIEEVEIPILDIYGSRDFKEVIDQAADRRLAGRKGENPWYQQIEIEGADHHFSGLDTVLNKRISGWLKKLIADYRVQQDNDEEAMDGADAATP